MTSCENWYEKSGRNDREMAKTGQYRDFDFLQDSADGEHEVMKSGLEESDMYRSHRK